MSKKFYGRRFQSKKMGPAITITKKQEVLTRQDVKGIVKRTVGKEIEIKYFDTKGSVAVGNTDVTTTSGAGQNLWDLAIIPRGTGPFQRIGAEIELVGINFVMHYDAADTSQNMRVIVFQWLGKSTPLNKYVLDYSSNVALRGGGEHYARDNNESFVILYDKTIHIESYVQPDSIVIRKYINLFKKRKGQKSKIQYDVDDIDGDGVTGGPKTNNLYMLLVSDSGTVPNPVFTFDHRLLYRDA